MKFKFNKFDGYHYSYDYNFRAIKEKDRLYNVYAYNDVNGEYDRFVGTVNRLKDVKPEMIKEVWFTIHSEKKAVYEVKKPFDKSRNRVYFGNEKTEFPAIGNTLAGNVIYDGAMPANAKKAFSEHGIRLLGTCPCNCLGCYAKRNTRYYGNSIAYTLNTIEMTTNSKRYWNLVQKDILKHYNKIVSMGGIIRINDSGDLYDLNNVLCLIDIIIKRFPEFIFYGYTEFPIFADIINECDNAVFWKSKFTTPCNGNGFTFVDDGTNDVIANMKHCPAIDKDGNKTGKKCSECKLCTKKDLIKKISFAFYKH